MNLVSVVTPVSNYHTHLLPRCSASVEAQTIPCAHIIVHDVDRRGAGAARNQGLRQVETPFVVFLDADDQIEPAFVEECLRAYDEKHYLYCDWFQDEVMITAPDCPWVNLKWHPITTLLPTAWAKHIDGFDETLPGGEDTDFYVKLTRGGMCGKRVAKPLFHYGKEGVRSKRFVNSLAYHALMKRLSDEFGGQPMACNGCGSNVDIPPAPVNQQQPGMILVKAVWGGNRQERGRITGTLYPRSGNGSLLWVYPEDAHAAPHMFQIVRSTAPNIPPAPKAPVLPKLPPQKEAGLNGVAEIAAYVNENSSNPERTPQALPESAPVASEVGDGRIDKVTRKARKAMSR